MIIGSQTITIVIIAISVIFIIGLQTLKIESNTQENKAVTMTALQNISLEIQEHQSDMLRKIPESNFTAQRQAVADIKQLMDDVKQIKQELLNNSNHTILAG